MLTLTKGTVSFRVTLLALFASSEQYSSLPITAALVSVIRVTDSPYPTFQQWLQTAH
jgi:hypothetical protein